MYYDILDKKRLALLPIFNPLKNEFYLGGGTALALQIGHRDSVDFDFFSNKEIDTIKLFAAVKDIFRGYKLVKTQEEKNTLSVIIDNEVNFSFLTYPYSLVKKRINEKNIYLASIEDIACMKLSAITSRATNKDYIDLYFILKNYDINEILKLAEKKFPDIDTNLMIKSLVYFEDVGIEPINFKHDARVDFGVVKEYLIKIVKRIK